MGMEAVVKFHGQPLPFRIVTQNRRAADTHKGRTCLRGAFRHCQRNFPMSERSGPHRKVKEGIRGGFHPEVFRFFRQEIRVEPIIVGYGFFIPVFIGLPDSQCSLVHRKFQGYPEPEGVLRTGNFVVFQHKPQQILLMLHNFPYTGMAEAMDLHGVFPAIPGIFPLLQSTKNRKQKRNAAPGTFLGMEVLFITVEVFTTLCTKTDNCGTFLRQNDNLGTAAVRDYILLHNILHVFSFMIWYFPGNVNFRTEKGRRLYASAR